MDIADDNCTGGEVPYGAFHVVTASDVDNTTRIDGFVITAGSAGGLSGLTASGGGMFIEDSDIAVVNCIIANNAAGDALASGGGEGGGVYLTGDADVHFINCEFLENIAAEGGAMHVEDGSTDVTLVNCLFARNEASHHGGGIDNETDEPAELNIYNCTFVENIAPAVAPDIGGGAIWTQDPEAIGVDGPTVLITNSIFWDNTPNQIDENAENPFTVRYTNIEGGWTGTGNINTAPTFGPGADNYRLMDDSAGVDVGNNADVQCDAFDVDDNGENCDAPAQDTPDLDLGDRIVGGTVDMGAYESVPCPADLDGSCDVGVKDLILLLGVWGPCEGCPADLDGPDGVPGDPVPDGVVGVHDLLFLIGVWGPCPCDPQAEVLSLQEELADACLTMDDWDEFADVMTDPESSQEDKDRYNCWMEHYLYGCSRCFCIGEGNCPDPFL